MVGSQSQLPPSYTNYCLQQDHLLIIQYGTHCEIINDIHDYIDTRCKAKNRFKYKLGQAKITPYEFVFKTNVSIALFWAKLLVKKPSM